MFGEIKIDSGSLSDLTCDASRPVSIEAMKSMVWRDPVGKVYPTARPEEARLKDALSATPRGSRGSVGSTG